MGIQENLPMPVGHHHPPGQLTAVVSLRSREICDFLLPLGCVSSLKYSRLADRRAYNAWQSSAVDSAVWDADLCFAVHCSAGRVHCSRCLPSGDSSV